MSHSVEAVSIAVNNPTYDTLPAVKQDTDQRAVCYKQKTVDIVSTSDKSLVSHNNSVTKSLPNDTKLEQRKVKQFCLFRLYYFLKDLLFGKHNKVDKQAESNKSSSEVHKEPKMKLYFEEFQDIDEEMTGNFSDDNIYDEVKHTNDKGESDESKPVRILDEFNDDSIYDDAMSSDMKGESDEWEPLKTCELDFAIHNYQKNEEMRDRLRKLNVELQNELVSKPETKKTKKTEVKFVKFSDEAPRVLDEEKFEYAKELNKYRKTKITMKDLQEGRAILRKYRAVNFRMKTRQFDKTLLEGKNNQQAWELLVDKKIISSDDAKCLQSTGLDLTHSPYLFNMAGEEISRKDQEVSDEK